MGEADHPDTVRIAKHLADLRMQVNALQVSAKHASPQELLKQARSAMRWSAIIVGVFLLGAAIVRTWTDRRLSILEKRVELLEKLQRPAPSP